MPTTTPDSAFKISRHQLEKHIQLLHTTLAEMRAVNLNNSPLQWHTKLRWEENIEQALVYFHQLLPSKET